MPASPQHAKPKSREEKRAARATKKAAKQAASQSSQERAGNQDRNATQAWPNDKPKPLDLPDCWGCSLDLMRPVPCQRYGIAAQRRT